MKKIFLALAIGFALTATVSCSNYETYADQKKKERNAISDFIAYKNIRTISEEDFRANGNTTNVANNEYVYMNNSGVYMQIVRKGAGKPLQDEETTELYIRFYQMSIFDTTNVVTNRFSPYLPDVMSITKSGTSYTASFTQGAMYNSYGASVPAGWLVPFNYINVDNATATEDISMVRLIVPHTQGHSVATSNVYPYFYEITFQRSPGL
jgi:hypothetical protein